LTDEKKNECSLVVQEQNVSEKRVRKESEKKSMAQEKKEDRSFGSIKISAIHGIHGSHGD